MTKQNRAKEEQGWCSGESTCLPPMWSRFDSWTGHLEKRQTSFFLLDTCPVEQASRDPFVLPTRIPTKKLFLFIIFFVGMIKGIAVCRVSGTIIYSVIIYFLTFATCTGLTKSCFLKLSGLLPLSVL